MVRQNATADLVGASVVKVPGGDDYDAEKEQQFGNTANVIGTNDSSKLNVFTSHTLGMVEGRHLKASDKHMSVSYTHLFIVVSSRKVNGFLLISTLAARFASFQAEEVRLVCRSQRERQTLRRFEWKDQWISVGLDVDGLGLFLHQWGLTFRRHPERRPIASNACLQEPWNSLPTRTGSLRRSPPAIAV